MMRVAQAKLLYKAPKDWVAKNICLDPCIFEFVNGNLQVYLTIRDSEWGYDSVEYCYRNKLHNPFGPSIIDYDHRGREIACKYHIYGKEVRGIDGKPEPQD